MNIAVAGTGYVGLSLAVLLAQKNDVTAVDIIPEKIALINAHKSPIVDREISQYLAEHELHLHATLDAEACYRNADFIIIATPTNYDVATESFDTSSIDSVLRIVERTNPRACVVIKSTVPVGFLDTIMAKFPSIPNILFSPEFLREGKALYDNLHPSRIVVGLPKKPTQQQKDLAYQFANLLKDAALDTDIPIRIVHATEAECIKLFANSYLALRVAYFNELDTFAEQYGLNASEIIDGICLDPRIGSHYNNPSFGYGGYCLPKDTRQLEANFANTPCAIVPAIVAANATRKHYIVSQILAKKPKVVGIYRLIMKAGSDNFRQSAIKDVMCGVRDAGIAVILYEPIVQTETFEGFTVVNDFATFVAQSDIILANRMTEELQPHRAKCYTRDIFQRD